MSTFNLFGMLMSTIALMMGVLDKSKIALCVGIIGWIALWVVARFTKDAASVNGCGTAFLTNEALPLNTATKWFTLFSFPLIPIRSYYLIGSIQPSSRYSSYTLIPAKGLGFIFVDIVKTWLRGVGYTIGIVAWALLIIGGIMLLGDKPSTWAVVAVIAVGKILGILLYYKIQDVLKSETCVPSAQVKSDSNNTARVQIPGSLCNKCGSKIILITGGRIGEEGLPICNACGDVTNADQADRAVEASE